MESKLKILFVEDEHTDFELIKREIKKNGIEFADKLVETREDYTEALQSFKPDIILSDYSLPQFNGMQALEIKKEVAPTVPFILVTGALNEETAVEIMKAGADDYIIKNQLTRIGSAIESAIGKWESIKAKKQAEEALKESEERFKMLFDKAPMGYQSLDENGHIIEVNETWSKILGYEKDDAVGKWFGDYLTPNDTEKFKKRFPVFKSTGNVQTEFEMIKKDGSKIIVGFKGRIGHTLENEFKQTHCTLTDITESRIAEEALKESEKKFRELANLLPQVVYEVDTNGHLVYLNDLGFELFGFPRNNLKNGLDVTKNIIPKDRERAKRSMQRHMSSKGKFIGNPEYTAMKRDGSRFPVLIYADVILKENKPNGLRGVIIDISELKQAQKALEASEKKYRRYFEKDISGIYLSTPDGKLLDCNLAFAEMLGYSIPEICELNTVLLYPNPTNRDSFLHKLTTNKNLVNSEIELVRKDGQIINCIENVVGIFNQEGDLIEFQGYVADITKRKQAEEKIRKLSQAVEQSPTSIVITDLKGEIEYTNPKFTQLTGYLTEEALGKKPSILKSGETPPEVYKKLWNTITSGNEWRGEFHNKKKNGELFWEFASISAIRNMEGKITHYLGVKEDITERKKVLEDLHESEQRFRSLFENHSAVMLLIDPVSGMIIDSNHAAANYYGYSRKELASMKIDNINTLTSSEIKKNRKLALKQKLNMFSFQHRLKDNSIRDVQVLSAPIGIKDNKLLFSIIYDITEQKRASKAQKESEEKYRKLIETTSEGFWLLDEDNITVDVNESLCKMLGYSRKEIIGKKPHNFVDWENNAVIEDQTLKSKTTKHRIYEVFMRKKNGDTFPTIFNATTITNDEGIQTGSFAFITDITDRKLAEEAIKRSEKQLRELTKYMDAKFEEERKRIGGEIHDGIGQLLTSIIMDLQWVEKKWPEESAKAKDKFKSMISTIDRGVKEVQQLAIQLRPEMLDKLGLLETIRSEAEIFDEKTGIYCDVQFVPEHFEVDSERTSTIYRVLMELLTNTYRYADATKIDIKLKRKNSEYVFIFNDNGIGITQDQIESKSSFGLMSISERVNKWNGTFDISGEPNKGTSVQITIPY
ncbi:MAG: PAS domain S-box protein [Bacteroidetes bacterium]|nr:PAS domain S-box protein [Bacteroidota bacterium]